MYIVILQIAISSDPITYGKILMGLYNKYTLLKTQSNGCRFLVTVQLESIDLFYNI